MSVLTGLLLSVTGSVHADTIEREHIRLRIDYLELRDAEAVDVAVRVNGKEMWSQRLPAQTLHVNLGPVPAPTRSAFSVVVKKPSGRVIGSATLSDSGTNATETVRQGEVVRLMISTRGVPVWAIPDLRVRVASKLSDAARKQLVEALVELNRRVIDLSDGQLRFAQFTIEEAPAGEPPDGALEIGACANDCSTAVGTPDAPALIRVASADVDQIVRAFEHAYLGVPDKRSCWTADGAAQTDTDDDDEFDCRFHLVTTLRAGAGLRLLPGGFRGPAPHSDPAMLFADEDAIDFGGGPAGLDDETINEEIAEHGEALAKCMETVRVPTARIKLSIRGEDGVVTWVRVNDQREGATHDCIAGVAKRMRFPPSDAKRTVAVFEMSR